MARSGFQSVDDYIAAQPEAVRLVLEQARAAIRKAIPKAEEVISYQIPAYRIDGQAVIYFAGFKAHFSLYPIAGAAVRAFKTELAPYEVNNKGTVRFPLGGRVPVGLIGKLAKFRSKEAAEAAKAKAGKTAAAKRRR
jgi:uncharacterized protein YdhG (YjbR/CyaY superfamily)